MIRIRAVFCGVLGLIVASGMASAADIPARMPVKAPASVAAPGYNWYGFYIGGHAGYAWADDHTSLLGSPALPAGVTSLFNHKQRGFIGGFQWGTNWQFNRWVLGTESDISYVDFDKTQTVLLGGVSNVERQRMEWFGTTRGRVGYAFDNVLLYGTGGLASGRVKTTITHLPLVGGVADSKYRYGWAAGGGVEWGWGPWSAKFEYLHYDLGNRNLLYPLGAATVTARTSNSGDLVRAGLNYRFAWTPWEVLFGR
ncbi:MAG: porin family protein [Proteobacteria bacterium]|nr:porin family protein [Pseudomonadota bacterium]